MTSSAGSGNFEPEITDANGSKISKRLSVVQTRMLTGTIFEIFYLKKIVKGRVTVAIPSAVPKVDRRRME